MGRRCSLVPALGGTGCDAVLRARVFWIAPDRRVIPVIYLNMLRLPLRSVLAVVTVAAAAAGCGQQLTEPAANGIVLSPVRASYAPGAEVSLTLQNTGSRVLEFGECLAYRVERQEGAPGTWRESYRSPSPLPCTLQGNTLAPGGAMTLRGFRLPTDLPAGTYRVRVVDLSGAASSPFTVQLGADQ